MDKEVPRVTVPINTRLAASSRLPSCVAVRSCLPEPTERRSAISAEFETSRLTFSGSARASLISKVMIQTVTVSLMLTRTCLFDLRKAASGGEVDRLTEVFSVSQPSLPLHSVSKSTSGDQLIHLAVLSFSASDSATSVVALLKVVPYDVRVRELLRLPVRGKYKQRARLHGTYICGRGGRVIFCRGIYCRFTG